VTHKPPVPDAATAPWPATPPPREHLPEAEKAENGEGGSRVSAIAVAAGVAVGSAAVAAALLFAGRISKPKSAANPPPPKPTPKERSGRTAADIQVGDSD
jgi:hypothetical protein